MPRNPEWLKTVRNLNMSVQSHLDALLEWHDDMMLNLAEGVYHHNERLLMKHHLELRDKITEARGLTREFQSILEENNHETFAAKEQAIFLKHRLKEKTP